MCVKTSPSLRHEMNSLHSKEIRLTYTYEQHLACWYSIIHSALFINGIGATTPCDPWDASLQLWRSWGPSVFGPLQLLQIAVIHTCWAL